MEHSIFTQMSILNHHSRPNSATYIDYIFTDYIEISGDRLFGDDPSILGGIALLDDLPVTIIGQQRGRNLEEKIKFNYSMSYPEGFRKSLRLMKQAEKFKRPIICFIDTIGAYPGREAEERGQSSAIANNLMEMMTLKVPIISVLLGYGGSGGAIALCVADRIAILENAMLGAASPKACAEILWKDTKREFEAVKMLKMTSKDLFEQGIVNFIVPEPIGGVQTNNVKETALQIKNYLVSEIYILSKLSTSKLLRKRHHRFRMIGQKG